MEHHTYVCTGCCTARRACRAGGFETALRCAICGGPLIELNPKCEIPKKSNHRAWSRLARNPFREWSPGRKLSLLEQAEKQLQEIDWQKALFEAEPPSESRETALQNLAAEREKVSRRRLALIAQLRPLPSPMQAAKPGGRRHKGPPDGQ